MNNNQNESLNEMFAFLLEDNPKHWLTICVHLNYKFKFLSKKVDNYHIIFERHIYSKEARIKIISKNYEELVKLSEKNLLFQFLYNAIIRRDYFYKYSNVVIYTEYTNSYLKFKNNQRDYSKIYTIAEKKDNKIKKNYKFINEVDKDFHQIFKHINL
jgi:hypothetical protein